MQVRKWIHLTLIVLMPGLLLAGLMLLSGRASGQDMAAETSMDQFMPPRSGAAVHSGSKEASLHAPIDGQPVAQVTTAQGATLQPTTTLTVTILSSPWATLDSNDPAGQSEIVPNVLLVQATVTNTGSVTATTVSLDLDYNEDPANNWLLLTGEDPRRSLTELPPGDDYVAYWFATYTTTIGLGHQYTVTVSADNAASHSVSDNVYGNPAPGQTAQTRSTLSAGNSGVSQLTTNITVGVAFTIAVDYDMGTNPQEAVFSPVGNPDFDPSAYRMLASEVTFYDDAQTQAQTVTDRTYFPTLPSFADNARATYTFVAVTPSDTRLCPYMAVGFQQNAKYDQDYCSASIGTVISVTGSVAMSLTKMATSQTVQQADRLTYTLQYTNHSALDLVGAWIWDDIDPAVGSIVASTVDPPSDPSASTGNRVAWNLGPIPAAGQPGSSGTLTFTLLVDGNGQDLLDGSQIVNHAYFGINPGSLPQLAVLTSTVTSTVRAPATQVGKSDGQLVVDAGSALTYTLRMTNSGSLTATGLVLTDILPTAVHYITGTAGESGRVGQTLVWNNQGPIPPNGGTLVITVPVTVEPALADGSILTNTLVAIYANEAGHIYLPLQATDTTLVRAPSLAIRKIAYPDPVLAGSSLTYTLFYTNSGPGAATNVAVTDTVPLSTTYQSCSGGSTCSMTNGVVRWTIGTVPGNSTGSVGFVVRASDVLSHGSSLVNQLYGIASYQTGAVTGVPLSTIVDRAAGWVQGHAFVDGDGDGVFDVGESTLPGVAVTLTSATTPLVTTDGAGTYRFRVESEGPKVVSSALPAGYLRTTAGSALATVTFGITETLDFGYAPLTTTLGVVYGTVFNDVDGNGTRDALEPGISGVTITLGASNVISTDAFGRYTHPSTAPGFLRVVETDPPGYFSTTPNDVQVNVAPGVSYRVDFGDAVDTSGFATIFGTVFEDQDGDGQQDSGEPGLPGVLVTLDHGSSVTITDQFGRYSFSMTLTGTHTVAETDLFGYFSTTPNSVQLGVIRGHHYEVNFGDALLGSGLSAIYGTVFEDADGDGQRDSGELGIPGVQVSLDGAMTMTTDIYGSYTFSTTVSGTHTVKESDLPGFFSTTPNEVHVDLGLGTSVEVSFGDAMTTSVFATIFGTVFEDKNSNGQWDADELGIPSVTVALDAATARTTDAFGSFTFATVQQGMHVATETDPFGYFSTTPNSVPVTITVGNGHQVDFGDVWAGDASCPPDSHEDDDAAGQAVILNVAVVQNHDFCDDAYDWQQFTATAGHVYTITTYSWGQRADTFLTLYDVDGQTILAANDDHQGAPDHSSRIVWQARSSGSYYVRTSNRAGLTGFASDYNVRLEERSVTLLYLPIVLGSPAAQLQATARKLSSLAPAGEIHHACPDSYEMDDSWETAAPITPGDTQIHSFDSDTRLYAADKDYVWFDMAPRATVTFTISAVTNTLTLMELYDQHGNALNIAATNQLVWSGSPAVRYYLSVTPLTPDSGCASEVGYVLSAQMRTPHSLFLPVIHRPS